MGGPGHQSREEKAQDSMISRGDGVVTHQVRAKGGCDSMGAGSIRSLDALFIQKNQCGAVDHTPSIDCV